MPTLQPSDGDTPQTFDAPGMTWSEEPAVPTPPVGTTPGTDGTTPQPPASATTSPVPPDGAGAGVAQQGPIPFDRHKEILETERRRAADAESKWQRVSWAETLAQAGFTQEDAILLAKNPVGFLDTLAQRMESHPHLAPQLRSIAARILGSQTPQAEQDPEPQPDQIGVFEDGRRTPVYSADQLRKWHEWHARQTQAAIDQRLAPFERQQDEQAKAARLDQLKQDALTRMHERLSQLRANPLFVEHEATFQAYLGDLVRRGQYPTIDQAWNDFYFAQVHPTLSRTEQARAVADLQTKAAASQAAPRAATAGTPANITRLDDPRLWR